MRSILLSAAALSLACALPAASFAQEPSKAPEADKTAATAPAKAKKHKTDKAEAPASASDASKPAADTTAPSDASSNPPADEKAPPADERPGEPKSTTAPQ